MPTSHTFTPLDLVLHGCLDLKRDLYSSTSYHGRDYRRGQSTVFLDTAGLLHVSAGLSGKEILSACCLPRIEEVNLYTQSTFARIPFPLSTKVESVVGVITRHEPLAAVVEARDGLDDDPIALRVVAPPPDE